MEESYTSGLISHYVIRSPKLSCYHSAAHNTFPCLCQFPCPSSSANVQFHAKVPTKTLSLSEYDLGSNLKDILLPSNMISFQLHAHSHTSTYLLLVLSLLPFFFTEDALLKLQKMPPVPFTIISPLFWYLAPSAILSLLCISNLSLSSRSFPSAYRAS